MQQQQTSLDDDLKRIQEEGYDLEVCGSYLIIRQVPYVTASKNVALGTLVCSLNITSPSRISPPRDHTIYFCGETPCNSEGKPLDSIINNSNRQQLTQELLVTHYFSSRPLSGNYPNYYEKIRTYAEILSIHAKAIDNTVTAKPFKN